ncbi:hypothetical protein KC207_00275 [Phycicoccus sp. BSK3Z-2]|uniref:DUF559 domain-containing protein n=1 Tax=Phycicoccus avicenniae TaxID=2828860 RepID=A0A941D4G8_9MICO|nr:hypothetical protein [Phycicoccus avicenniae]MBR7741730.1 hypothetical protein [Phycicoccus avicenniae]
MPRPLPRTAFPAGPFRPADLVAAGHPVARTRHPSLARPTRGVRSPAWPSDLQDRVAAFTLALPADVAFSHRTAALLHGMPMPRSVERDPVLDIMRRSDRTRIRRAGCRGHRGLERRAVDEVSGVRVVGLADTWCDLGECVGPTLGRDDLVVAADSVVGRLEAGAGSLRQVLDGRCRPRGRRVLLDALSLVRPGVRSPMETRARLMFHDAGFPEPEVNGVVRDAAGGWLLEGDLVWRDQQVVGEYQGEDHADRRRRSTDAQRAGLASDLGWTVLELFAEDVWRSPRRRLTLLRFARELGLETSGLRIG